MRLPLSALAVVLCGCGLVASNDGGSVIALVITNGSADEISLVIEQPDGEVSRLPYQPCSSHSEPLEQPWQLEVGAIVALASEDVEPILGAPFTVVRVDVLPDGELRISAPEGSRTMPDVPLTFACG